eukprot:Amastigsp_a680836_12.p2 type:complete len:171 gc:universal Amastigsp_a680836_12:246-758(+)
MGDASHESCAERDEASESSLGDRLDESHGAVLRENDVAVPDALRERAVSHRDGDAEGGRGASGELEHGSMKELCALLGLDRFAIHAREDVELGARGAREDVDGLSVDEELRGEHLDFVVVAGEQIERAVVAAIPEQPHRAADVCDEDKVADGREPGGVELPVVERLLLEL